MQNQKQTKMKAENFEILIQQITGRDFKIRSGASIELQPDTEYLVYRTLPITQRAVCFMWKTAKTEEKLLRSFITAFTTKYREPNPKAYDHEYGGKMYFWNDKTEEQKEYAYSNHVSNMFHKNELLEQVQNNFSKPDIEQTLLKYGFYTTEYGIGIFCFWQTNYVLSAMNKMKEFLRAQSIPFLNEFSDAQWVYRFKLNLTKEAHNNILSSFV